MAKRKVAVKGDGKPVDAEHLPVRLSAAAAREIANPLNVERFNRFLEEVAGGATLTEAFAVSGLSPALLAVHAGRDSALMAEIKGVREGYREIGMLLAMIEVVRRVSERTEELSARDMTDFLRALRPVDGAVVERAQLVGIYRE